MFVIREDINDTLVYDYWLQGRCFLTNAEKRLLFPVSLHTKDLHETNENVDHIELETDGFSKRVTLHQTLLNHPSMLQYLLGATKIINTRNPSSQV